jgi:flagellar FliL protein
MPLLVAMLAMPVLAYVTTEYILVPRVQQAVANSVTTEAPAEPSAPGLGVKGRADKVSVSLNKILVNVAGSMGSRYLVANITVAGSRADLEKLIEGNKAQLTDLASGILGSKTIEDLEKPGARNLVRGELLASFNAALGEGTINELYLTEFAVQ